MLVLVPLLAPWLLFCPPAFLFCFGHCSAPSNAPPWELTQVCAHMTWTMTRAWTQGMFQHYVSTCFHWFLDLRYCTTNSLISFYVAKLAASWIQRDLRRWNFGRYFGQNCALDVLVELFRLFPFVLRNFAFPLFQASLPLTFLPGESRVRQGSQKGKQFVFVFRLEAGMRRHSSRPFRSGTNMAIAGIFLAWHYPTRMAKNKLVDNCSSALIISTVANSFFSTPAFFNRPGYVESTVLIHVTKPNL